VLPQEALALFAVLMGVALVLALLSNRMTLLLAFGGAFLAATYPLMKRYTHLPQVYLGAAFGWAVPMAWAGQTGQFPPPLAWLVFLTAVVWAVIYDTQYAMVDRDDDLKIGVKSTAILFGEQDRAILAALQGLMTLALFLIGRQAGLGWPYFCRWRGGGVVRLPATADAGSQPRRFFRGFSQQQLGGRPGFRRHFGRLSGLSRGMLRGAARWRPYLDLHAPGRAQGQAHRRECAAGGEHVIDQRHMGRRNAINGESPAQVAGTRHSGQAHLGCGRADAADEVIAQRDGKMPGQWQCQFACLIESAFPQPAGVQRDRNQRRRPGCMAIRLQGLHQQRAQQPCPRQASMKLQLLHHGIDGQGIVQGAEGKVPGGRVAQAGAATPGRRSCGQGSGAARTGRGVPG